MEINMKIGIQGINRKFSIAALKFPIFPCVAWEKNTQMIQHKNFEIMMMREF